MQIADVKSPDETVGYDDDLLLKIRAGVVSVLIRGRNAWHSTWVRHYFKNAALYSTNQSARVGAERLRGPGNVFYISETPALLLQGEKRGLLICDSNSAAPFTDFMGDQQRIRGEENDRWIDGLYPGVSLWDAFETFSLQSEFWRHGSRSQYSLKFGEVPSDFAFVEGEGLLLSWKSYAQGGTYPLGWQKSGPGFSRQTESVGRVIAYWDSRLSEVAPFAGRSAEVGSADLARYREAALGAVPRSVWRAERLRQTREARLSISDAEEVAAEASRLSFEARVAVYRARTAVASAKLAFLKPADTSSGIREQIRAAETAEEELAVAETRFTQLEDEDRVARKALEIKRAELRSSGLWP